jgi:MoxR-like ATPase
VVEAHPDFQLVISYNPGYQSLMKDLKQSTKQRFTAFDFDYPEAGLEAGIVATETGIDAATAGRLVQVAQAARNLKGHGLDEGISTRLVVYAATLMRQGVAAGRCLPHGHGAADHRRRRHPRHARQCDRQRLRLRQESALTTRRFDGMPLMASAFDR